MTDGAQYLSPHETIQSPAEILKSKVLEIRELFEEYAGRNVSNLAATHTAGVLFFHAGVEGMSEVLRSIDDLQHIFTVAFLKEPNEVARSVFIDKLYAALMRLRDLVSKPGYKEFGLTEGIIDNAMLWIEDFSFNETQTIKARRNLDKGLGLQSNKGEM